MVGEWCLPGALGLGKRARSIDEATPLSGGPSIIKQQHQREPVGSARPDRSDGRDFDRPWPLGQFGVTKVSFSGGMSFSIYFRDYQKCDPNGPVQVIGAGMLTSDEKRILTDEEKQNLVQ